MVVSGSEASVSAAKYAIVMAKASQSMLYAVYVVDEAAVRKLTLSKVFVQEESLEYQNSLEANGKRYLSFIEDLARAKNVKIGIEIRKGITYSEIIAAAAEKKADLIILGAWEKDRKSRDIISHSGREIIIHAKCSVLLVKEPNIDRIYNQA